MDSILAVQKGEIVTIMDGAAVAGQKTVYSDAFVIENNEYFTVFLKASASTGTPHVKITRCYNFSTIDPAESDKWAEAEPDGTEDLLIADFSATTWRVEAEHPKYSVWCRYKIEGLITNSANTKLSMVFVKQKKDWNG